MKRTAKSRGRRKIPVPGLIEMRGACAYFDESDAKALEKVIGLPLQIAPDQLAGRLNLDSEDFLVRYAHERVPTASSKTAEWCEALVRDVDGLLTTIGVPDAGYPMMEMDLDARTVLTNVGTGSALSDFHFRSMKLGGDTWNVLDRVPAALWALKQIAKHAATEYRKYAVAGRSRKNARQPQHVYLLGATARTLEKGYGLEPPASRPNPAGPFIRAVDFVRLRIVEKIEAGDLFVVQGTDKQAAKRLRQFTPNAAASLWAREGTQIRKDLERDRLRSMMERPQP